MINRDIEEALRAIYHEADQARRVHPPFHSCHEGYALIKEEFEELWEEIKHNPRDMAKVKLEAIQTGAMVLRFLAELCGGEG